VSGLLDLLGVRIPLIQAPMAGVSNPVLAAAVSGAGALGSIAVGTADVAQARAMIRDTRARTDRPFNLNLFCHRRPRRESDRELRWLAALAPTFKSFDAQPPDHLSEVYRTFVGDHEMLAMLLEERPPVVSFHFGFPSAEAIASLRAADIVLLGSATNLDEAQALERAGIAAIVAQGYEAGGHRGTMDAGALDDRLGTFALTRLLASRCRVPVIAAGGIMDGAGIAACLALGAAGAQLGTAFVGCPESSADAAYRAVLFSPAAAHTTMTRVISGRPARCLANGFTELARTIDEADAPDYPLAYAAGKALAAAARADGDQRFGAHWAGQGAPLARALPAAELVAVLADELSRAAAGAPSK
jgi:nitronate monooxygenase